LFVNTHSEPCTMDGISVTEGENRLLRINGTYVILFWESLKVAISEEYLLMDLGAIVATVGGSLGLFLGNDLNDLKLLTI
jgi:hypothetical protein